MFVDLKSSKLFSNFFRESKRENSKRVEESLGVLHKESARRFKEAQKQVPDKKRTDAFRNNSAANKAIENEINLLLVLAKC